MTLLRCMFGCIQKIANRINIIILDCYTISSMDCTPEHNPIRSNIVQKPLEIRAFSFGGVQEISFGLKVREKRLSTLRNNDKPLTGHTVED